MRIILGIDPGSRITGFGVIKVNGRVCEYIASGCIKVLTGEVPNRLKQIYDSIGTLIEQYQPTEAAIEKIFMCKSADSALKLGQARGVAMVAMAGHELTIAEYSALQVKQAVVGYGKADKLQVQHMVKTLLKLPASPQADAADALAIALCHYHSQTQLMKVGALGKHVRRRVR